MLARIWKVSMAKLWCEESNLHFACCLSSDRHFRIDKPLLTINSNKAQMTVESDTKMEIFWNRVACARPTKCFWRLFLTVIQPAPIHFKTKWYWSHYLCCNALVKNCTWILSELYVAIWSSPQGSAAGAGSLYRLRGGLRGFIVWVRSRAGLGSWLRPAH